MPRRPTSSNDGSATTKEPATSWLKLPHLSNLSSLLSPRAGPRTDRRVSEELEPPPYCLVHRFSEECSCEQAMTPLVSSREAIQVLRRRYIERTASHEEVTPCYDTGTPTRRRRESVPATNASARRPQLRLHKVEFTSEDEARQTALSPLSSPHGVRMATLTSLPDISVQSCPERHLSAQSTPSGVKRSPTSGGIWGSPVGSSPIRGIQGARVQRHVLTEKRLESLAQLPPGPGLPKSPYMGRGGPHWGSQLSKGSAILPFAPTGVPRP